MEAGAAPQEAFGYQLRGLINLEMRRFHDASEIVDLYLERATVYKLLGDRVSAEKDRLRATAT